ncbi:SMP-30/Gluconolaconase/LRE-like region-containing protein [Butyrivibrio fibrisolvens DSM 3071]|uniref:SMP-30/Gluconolaconase/LRE-like region-containing protein n=1 Tax=Butyrivibrio fibrisolvens DSM 3071 TaxID=1121131 RepID=A0A1M5YP95_BUTFI|nr:SMP-30/Gluconolaconase/LRE-like region-containing protein [Butyrivibrio fibrisolvens DSM 3071]
MLLKPKPLISILALFIVTTGIWIASFISASANAPYESYNYNFWGEAVAQPHTFLYKKSFLGAGDKNSDTTLNFPKDMFLKGEKLYIADTGNSRILVTDFDGNVLNEYTCASDSSDTFKEPQGVFVTDEDHIYIADSGNSRLVELDEKGAFVREIGRPVTTLITDSQQYTPIKVVVDHAGRIYVIAYGINMGLIEFDKNGEFQGFMGATEVSVSMFTYIWKNYFSTKQQQERMATIVPTEYSNICVDKENFIYATINNLSGEDLASGADAIRRLNPTGVDVLRRLSNNKIIGDLDGYQNGWSSFCDVAVNDDGCYFVLDNNDGKIFAYDYDGNNLFVFGQIGIKEGNFQKPVAIALSEDEKKIFVLDNVLGNVMEFDITDYGELLLGAIRNNSIGNSEEATRLWNEVATYNSNNELAYIGLGKASMDAEDYKAAMEYFKLGNNRKYYSKALYYYRKEMMEKFFARGMLIIIIVIVTAICIKGFFAYKKWVGKVKCYMENH